MAVTLNFTSKGLIHAIRTQLEQQKKEGKISGDTSYKSIATCDFWSTLKEINDKHDKKNKVFHGKGYGCEDKGQNTDWTKTIVVYGSTTLSDEEWESLIQSMGLELSKKTEKEETKPVEEKKEEVKKEDPTEVKDIQLATTSVLLNKLEKEHNLTKGVSARIAQKAAEDGYKFSIEDEQIVVKDKQKNVISLTELINRMEVADMKSKSTADNKAEIKKDTVVPQQPIDQNFDKLLRTQNTNLWNTQIEE